MTNTVNIPEKIYSDKFDVSKTASLSFFLYNNKAFLQARDITDKITAIHQLHYQDKKSLINQAVEDQLYKINVPTDIFVHRQHFCLVPGVLYDPDHISTYLLLAGDKNSENKPFSTNLESHNLQLLGSIDMELWEALSAGKDTINFHHGAASFLSYVLGEKPKLVNQELIIMIFDHYCYLSAFSNQELVLFNWFEIEDKEALLRYIFGIKHQLKFEQKHCKVSVFGEFNKLGITEDWGVTYFNNFNTLKPEKNFQYQDEVAIFMESNIFESYWQFQP